VDVQEVRKLEDYLKNLFGNARLRVVPKPKQQDTAEVQIADDLVGVLTVDDEDNDRSYNLEVKFAARVLGGNETQSLEGFFKNNFGSAIFRVKRPPKKRDSFEVYVGEEFIGVLYIEGEGERRFYVLEMAILEMDLTPEAG
jgi:Protein of unknown function (DUF3126)